jgi:hypothetical protein
VEGFGCRGKVVGVLVPSIGCVIPGGQLVPFVHRCLQASDQLMEPVAEIGLQRRDWIPAAEQGFRCVVQQLSPRLCLGESTSCRRGAERQHCKAMLRDGER